MISRTSRSPPVSILTLFGLRVTSSVALSTFPGLGGTRGRFEGLASTAADANPAGVLLFPDDTVAGISSHSSPAMFSGLRKNGHRLVSISSDSFASEREIGTGEDLITACATSEVGRVRRLRAVGVALLLLAAGVEKNLYMVSAFGLTREETSLHPHALRDATEPTKEAASAHLFLAHLEHEIARHLASRDFLHRGFRRCARNGFLANPVVKCLSACGSWCLRNRRCISTSLTRRRRRSRRFQRVVERRHGGPRGSRRREDGVFANRVSVSRGLGHRGALRG